MGIWPVGRRPARKHSVLARPKHGPARNAPCPGWPGPLAVPVHGPPPQQVGRPGPARREKYQPVKARYPHTPSRPTPQPSPTSTVGRRPRLHIYTRRWRPTPHAQTLIHFPRRPQRLAASLVQISNRPSPSSPALLRSSASALRSAAGTPTPAFPSHLR
jgi:hypothetical protein